MKVNTSAIPVIQWWTSQEKGQCLSSRSGELPLLLLDTELCLFAYIAVAAHSRAESGPAESISTDFTRSVKHSLRRAKSRLSGFFFFFSAASLHSKARWQKPGGTVKESGRIPCSMQHKVQPTNLVIRQEHDQGTKQKERLNIKCRVQNNSLSNSFLTLRVSCNCTINLLQDVLTMLCWKGVQVLRCAAH